jgi:hypothetical protein
MDGVKGFGRKWNSGIRLKRLSKTTKISVRIVNNLAESPIEV